MTAEVAQAKESERETARRRDEEVRHLREQVEQLILSFNSAQSQSAAAAGGSKSTEVCEQTAHHGPCSRANTRHCPQDPPPVVAAASGRAASPPLVAEGAAGAAGAAAASAGGRQASAATLVQSVWRGYTDRRKLSDLMEDLGYFDEGGEFSLADFHYVRHAA